MNMDYEGLGKRIRTIRRQRGLTQKDAAIKVGISTAFFGLIERGQRKASIETLVSISNVLNASMDELLLDSLSLKKESESENYEIISSNFKIMSDAFKKIQEYM